MGKNYLRVVCNPVDEQVDIGKSGASAVAAAKKFLKRHPSISPPSSIELSHSPRKNGKATVGPLLASAIDFNNIPVGNIRARQKKLTDEESELLFYWALMILGSASIPPGFQYVPNEAEKNGEAKASEVSEDFKKSAIQYYSRKSVSRAWLIFAGTLFACGAIAGGVLAYWGISLFVTVFSAVGLQAAAGFITGLALGWGIVFGAVATGGLALAAALGIYLTYKLCTDWGPRFVKFCRNHLKNSPERQHLLAGVDRPAGPSKKPRSFVIITSDGAGVSAGSSPSGSPSSSGAEVYRALGAPVPQVALGNFDPGQKIWRYKIQGEIIRGSKTVTKEYSFSFVRTGINERDLEDVQQEYERYITRILRINPFVNIELFRCYTESDNGKITAEAFVPDNVPAGQAGASENMDALCKSFSEVKFEELFYGKVHALQEPFTIGQGYLMKCTLGDGSGSSECAFSLDVSRITDEDIGKRLLSDKCERYFNYVLSKSEHPSAITVELFRYNADGTLVPIKKPVDEAVQPGREENMSRFVRLFYKEFDEIKKQCELEKAKSDKMSERRSEEMLDGMLASPYHRSMASGGGR